jgi:predicted flap endonuclease-1-like 5' DNA nuclease
MKTKLVLWGRNAQDERVLIALQLRPQDNKVDLWTFPETIATEDFSQKMLNEWRNGTKIDFPEGFTHSEKELSITESLLPEDLKVERGDLIQRAQTEWHFMVLSSKLNETYQTELQEIKEKVAQLTSYSGDVWEELKGFWAKVQTQVRDRNLFREHANDLRDNTNELFGKMKELRKSLDKEFQAKSEEHMNTFKTGLGEIKERLEKGLNLNGIFEDLKKMQREFKETKLSRDHRSTIWEQLDGLFKEVKNKRYGGESNSQGGNSTPSERLKRRYDGLLSALGKMEQSINRDKRDLDFQDRKAGQSGGQLEAQLREAKIMMIKERIRSKEEKLGEMLQTKAELEKRMEVQAEKDARRAEQDKVQEAKREAAQKIKEKIKAEEEARAGDDEKLKEAAEKMKGKKEAPAEESIVEKIATEIEETLEDVVDTVKAVAHVVSEKIDEAVESFNAPETAEEKTEEAPAEPAKAADFTAKDDLKIVEGIGPKIEEILNTAGISTFSELENTAVEKLKAILAEAGGRYNSHNPATWPKQAGMAVAGKLDELKKWQDELDGGKEVKTSGEEE